MVRQADHDGETMQIPDGVEPIVGWRGFALDTNDWTLCSLNASSEWQAENNVAGCDVHVSRHSKQETLLGMSRRSVIQRLQGLVSEAELEALLATISMDIPEHSPPEPDCSCGFYALSSMLGMFEALNGYGDLIFGRVGLYGRVIVGTKGYRAERADITGILVVPWTMRDSSGTWWGSYGDMSANVTVNGRLRHQARVARAYGVPLLWDLCESYVRLVGGPGDGKLVPTPEGFTPHAPLVIRVGPGRAALYTPRRAPLMIDGEDSHLLVSTGAWLADFHGMTVIPGELTPDRRL